MCWVQPLTSTIQFLCISIPETLLHVIMKGRAGISADDFAGLLRYFILSYKNFTIIWVLASLTSLITAKRQTILTSRERVFQVLHFLQPKNQKLMSFL